MTWTEVPDAELQSRAADRARTLVDLGRWQVAEQTLAPMLADPGSGAEPWCLLAQCRLGQDDLRGAGEAAERAASIDPESEWAHRLRATALLRSRWRPGRRRACIAAAQRSVALAPGLDNALYTLTLAQLGWLGLSRAAQARAWETASANLLQNPNSVLAMIGACQVCLSRRRWQEAEALARRGLAVDPHNPDLLRHLAAALTSQHRSGEAGLVLAAAAREEPTSDASRVALADLGSATIGRSLTWWQWALLVLVLLPLSGVLLPGLLIWLLIQWVAHLGARSELPPHLRRIAVRERRRARAPALAVVALLCLALALMAGLARAWSGAVTWVAFAALPGTLWWLWRAPRS